mgnify:CR=1 FL=1
MELIILGATFFGFLVLGVPVAFAIGLVVDFARPKPAMIPGTMESVEGEDLSAEGDAVPVLQAKD